jgi:hypothetical protein
MKAMQLLKSAVINGLLLISFTGGIVLLSSEANVSDNPCNTISTNDGSCGQAQICGISPRKTCQTTGGPKVFDCECLPTN